MLSSSKHKRVRSKLAGYSKEKAARKLTDTQRQLVEDNVQLAYWFAGREQWRPYQVSQDEWLSECMYVLVKAARAFKPELGFKFSTYYSRSFFGRRSVVVNVIRKRREFVWDGDEDFSPLAIIAAEDCDPSEGLDIDDLSALLRDIWANIPRSYRDGFDYWLRRFGGESASSIARQVGVSRQAICQRCEKAMRFMRIYVRRQMMVLE